MFLYQKLIDWPTLRQGFQIPVVFHHLLNAIPGGMPQHRDTFLKSQVGKAPKLRFTSQMG